MGFTGKPVREYDIPKPEPIHIPRWTERPDEQPSRQPVMPMVPEREREPVPA